MIDLQSFCANQWEARSYLQRPWRDGEWVYATNGHMIVRVPAESAPDVEARTGAQPNNPPDMFRVALEQEGEFLLMPPLPADIVCSFCIGGGADDDGDECPQCFGTKHAFTFFQLGDSGYNLHYLHQLAVLPQVRIRTHGAKAAAAVIFDGGQALVMPMRVSVESAGMTTKPVPAGCGQQRWPERRGGAHQEAASACSEPLADDENAEARFRCQRARALFWQFYLVVVLASIGAAIPYVLPLLRAWMKN